MAEKTEQSEKTSKTDQITVNVTSGAFPLKLWKEWDADCKENFGDCRWMKMWHDHLIAKTHKVFLELFNVSEVQTEEKQETKVKTLGGEVGGDKDE